MPDDGVVVGDQDAGSAAGVMRRPVRRQVEGDPCPAGWRVINGELAADERGALAHAANPCTSDSVAGRPRPSSVISDLNMGRGVRRLSSAWRAPPWRATLVRLSCTMR